MELVEIEFILLPPPNAVEKQPYRFIQRDHGVDLATDEHGLTRIISWNQKTIRLNFTPSRPKLIRRPILSSDVLSSLSNWASSSGL